MKTLFIAIIWGLSLNDFILDLPKNPGERKAIYLVNHLPEVITNNRYALKTYKRPLVITVDSDPLNGKNYYSLSVYYNRPDIQKLNNLYHFEVDINTNTIRVWDISADKIMSLKEWRQRLFKRQSSPYAHL